jgi:thymidylate synthase ThyX
MTTISAKIIKDSISNGNPRLTTMLLTYPRCIHGEFMTHRVFSRNASSSRAIPVSKQIAMIESNPFIPKYWGKNQKGMQADEECNELVEITEFQEYDNVYNDDVDEDEYLDIRKKVILSVSSKVAWLNAMESALKAARAFDKASYHKQIVNRLLEPFAHITVVVTATEWDNFFELRLHKDAEPHMQELAKVMKFAMDSSTPELLTKRHYHLPFITQEDWQAASFKLIGEFNNDFRAVQNILVKASVARCARTSYLNHDGSSPDLDKDIALHDMLVSSRPKHLSPAEHQAKPATKDKKAFYKNLRGWEPYRGVVEYA